MDDRSGAPVAEVLPLPIGGNPEAPGPFAFADPDRVTGILTAAGFNNPTATHASATLWMGDNATEAAAFLRTTGLGRAVFADADPTLMEEAMARVTDVLVPYETDSGVELAVGLAGHRVQLDGHLGTEQSAEEFGALTADEQVESFSGGAWMPRGPRTGASTLAAARVVARQRGSALEVEVVGHRHPVTWGWVSYIRTATMTPERGDGGDGACGVEPEGVGDDPGEEGADGEAAGRATAGRCRPTGPARTGEQRPRSLRRM